MNLVPRQLSSNPKAKSKKQKEEEEEEEEEILGLWATCTSTYLLPFFFSHQPQIYDLLWRDWPVSLISFCCRSHHVSLELVVFNQAVRKVIAAIASHTFAVVRPNGSACRASQVAPHDELDRKDTALLHNCNVRMRRRKKGVIHNALALVQPPHARLVSHLALERN